MNAWKKKLADGAETTVVFAADDAGSWGAASGLLFDAGAFLGGPRLQRAAIIVQVRLLATLVRRATTHACSAFPHRTARLSRSSSRTARQRSPSALLTASWPSCRSGRGSIWKANTRRGMAADYIREPIQS